MKEKCIIEKKDEMEIKHVDELISEKLAAEEKKLMEEEEQKLVSLKR